MRVRGKGQGVRGTGICRRQSAKMCAKKNQKQRDRERKLKKITPSCWKMLLKMYAYT